MPTTEAHDAAITSGRPDRRTRFILALIFAAIALLLCIADRAPMHLASRFHDVRIGEEFTFYYDGVVNRTLPGPYVYRVLIPFSVYLLNKLAPFADPVSIDFILKAALLLACQLVFYRYLRYFFASMTSFAGVLWFDALAGFSLSYIQGPSLIETGDIFNVLIYTLAFEAIYRNNFWPACAILVIGLLNRESVLLVPVVMAFAGRDRRRGVARGAVAATIVAICYIAERMIISPGSSDWMTTVGMGRNIPLLSPELTLHAIAGNVHVIVLLGPLVALGAVRFTSHPVFLKSAAAIAPLFILIHYVFGTIIEARLWMPLFVILIPLALANIEYAFARESIHTTHNPHLP